MRGRGHARKLTVDEETSTGANTKAPERARAGQELTACLCGPGMTGPGRCAEQLALGRVEGSHDMIERTLRFSDEARLLGEEARRSGRGLDY